MIGVDVSGVDYLLELLDDGWIIIVRRYDGRVSGQDVLGEFRIVAVEGFQGSNSGQEAIFFDERAAFFLPHRFDGFGDSKFENSITVGYCVLVLRRTFVLC